MFATIVKWVSISALLMAAMFWSSAADYQLLLAFVVCLGAVVVVQQAAQAGEYLWAAGFVVIAVLSFSWRGWRPIRANCRVSARPASPRSGR